MNTVLYEQLCKLNTMQFKVFYSMLVHYWVNYKYFISKQNLFNLWCELNKLCHEIDESFPDQYDDHELIKSFCQTHPYYFIDKLPINLIAGLFTQYVDNRIEILVNTANTLLEFDTYVAYAYLAETLGLNEMPGELATETQDYINSFS